MSRELDEARAGFDAEALAVLETHAVPFGGDRSDALALAVAWQLHVVKLDQDRALDWEDRSVWSEHDLAAALLLRDAAEEALAVLPQDHEALRAAVSRRLDDADARFRGMTVDDTGERMARIAGRTGARGWWWFRVPSSGPIVRDLERYA